jgi:hypothetical protein
MLLTPTAHAQKRFLFSEMPGVSSILSADFHVLSMQARFQRTTLWLRVTSFPWGT